jgi:hypothetical protein
MGTTSAQHVLHGPHSVCIGDSTRNHVSDPDRATEAIVLALGREDQRSGQHLAQQITSALCRHERAHGDHFLNRSAPDLELLVHLSRHRLAVDVRQRAPFDLRDAGDETFTFGLSGTQLRNQGFQGASGFDGRRESRNFLLDAR